MFILLLVFLLFFSQCSYSLICINLLYLALFNFAFLFFLSFLPFLSFPHPCLFVLFSLLYPPITILLQFCFPVCALVSFVFNWLISLFVSFACQVNLLHFISFGFFWFCLWVYMYVPIFCYFTYYLPDFVSVICLGCLFCFLCLCVCFNAS